MSLCRILTLRSDLILQRTILIHSRDSNPEVTATREELELGLGLGEATATREEVVRVRVAEVTGTRKEFVVAIMKCSHA